MRTIPPALAERLAGAATTLATCFVARLADGTVMGFTDHDRTLMVDGVACEPASGFDRSVAGRGADFAVGEEEIAGALTSDRITEADLADGRWDGARVEVHLVDSSEPEARMPVRTATLGEAVRADGAFRAELRGPAHALGQPIGRVFTRTCDAALGDARCGVDLSTFTTAATVTAVDAAGRITVAGAEALPERWFAGGTATVTAGPRAGFALAIADHFPEDGATVLVPWRAPATPLEAGTALALVAGCDKRFETCRDRFANADAFRGFPHMPGQDFVFSYARGDGDDDGGVLF
ncbi:DUF2163 domain-containing protein [Oharaeibacter diazotrophicus]|uniref:Putative phage protein (TIGR02218 family) n=1 Tax=Oharaeibacter diazotrophicus TaxID=1920512 RepID=A0A4R6RB31_9HYPH|nr:DUF2163 domain-containing protein [Oharaeibacter diazotrophicus]TDP83214.1 putative phage protein (TIGR02218 family) [Oharaeibacter diazotrophicus]BBE72045.1 hypothetical protein OHA_1_01632 [Pleomorphomonas sp. SM30]GLS78810.1 hypothetical protein GCM10007904_41470 [Oharaeibacter diazotrophicus]